MDSLKVANQIRIDSVNMTHNSKMSHVASALSVADILAVLYTDVLNISPKNLTKNNRDRLIFSKGHAGMSVYSALSSKKIINREILKKYAVDNSSYSGHISHINKGVEWSTGSLGHGLSVGAGIAYGLKQDKISSKVFVIIGDGEFQEGSIFEALNFADYFHLNNLHLIIDNNKMQAMETYMTSNVEKKLKSFNWDTVSIDGHNHNELNKALKRNSKKPMATVANTIKGKGVSFMENQLLWHYKNPDDEFYKNAIAELKKNKK
jgi:transketolase